MLNKTRILLLFTIVIFALFASGLSLNAQDKPDLTPGDTTSVEYWRQKGFEAKMKEDIDLSLTNYMKVLLIAPSDWDANLAVARILFAREEYQESSLHFLRVHEYDSTNTEVLYGLGRCSYRQDKFSEAEKWYRKTLEYMPGHLPLLEDLSYALVNSGRSEQALDVYKKMIEADPSMSMAWSGIGRIYLVTGKPAAAAKHFKKALELEPDNKEIESSYRQAKYQLAFVVGYQFMFINENEPIDIGSDTAAYNIDALVQSISLTKRVSDRFIIRFSHLLDRSFREYYNENDTLRWYDVTSLRATMILGSHRLTGYFGISYFEDKIPTYGLAWDFSKRFGKVRLNNTMSSGYEYYYYWNQVGHDFIADNLKITLGRFVLDASYRYVNVREPKPLELEGKERNPGHQYTFTGRYSFFKNPKVTLGIYHHYRGYEYKSPRYWSPQDRKLNGAILNLYFESKKGLVVSATGNIGKDSDDIEHWEAAGEIGYNRKNMSYAIGASRFYNPWYENFIAYISVTRRLARL